MRNELDIIAEKNYAREEGRAENSREIAAKLLSEGVALEIIQCVIGLSEQEIAALK